MVIEKAMSYCRSILQNVSRSFALTIPLVEKNILVPILVGYLEARILDSFEDERFGKVEKRKRIENIKKVISVIKDPDTIKSKRDIDEISRAAADVISNPHYLDLAQNIGKVMEVHKTMDQDAKSSISFWFERMSEGMRKYINKRIETFEELDEYCYYVGGTVGGMLTDLIVNRSNEAVPEQIRVLRREQRGFGLFLQKVNIIRDFREDMLKNEKIFWPYQLFEEYGISPREALERRNERKSLAILERMIKNAEKHINSVKNYIKSIPMDFPGFRKASIINFLMGVETLRKMKGNPDVFFSERPVKIGRGAVMEIMRRPEEMFLAICR